MVKHSLRRKSVRVKMKRLIRSKLQRVSTIKKLIESVRNNPCLYNTDNENFNNEDLKTLTWTTIAAECNFPNGASAKAEWKNLLIRLINALTFNGQGQTNRVQKTWQYKKQMEFVLPYITDEEIHTLRHTNPDTTNYHTRHSQRIETLQSTKRKRQDTVEASTSNADGGQPLDMFFLSMCATTKNLPSYVQLQVKKKIFNAVIEAEEIVAAMHNDQAKNSMFDATPGTHDDEYQNNLSPFSVQSNAEEEWQDN
ncbi:hypothetical protein RI129_012562 [Pyrocoelia pectoralis]|uniref:MADF domain-containing protein n=1 Tax=Pyrocoelia pectoralis TaxID=417401 RepID=A0AAN7ZC74_9COLE